MGKFIDFFRTLGINPNIEDDNSEKELQDFMAENVASAKRVDALERRFRVDVGKKATTRSKPIVSQVETPKTKITKLEEKEERDER